METREFREQNGPSFFIIHRDVYKKNENGLWVKKVKREYLLLTKSGRYVWQDDPQQATDFNINESDDILTNLQRMIRPKFIYGKKWIYRR